MREVRYEVIHPTQRSPCRGCGREFEDKNLCAEDCGRLRRFRVAAGLDMEEDTMPIRAGNDMKAKAPAPKPRRKTEPRTPKPTVEKESPTLGQIVRKILDGFPGGHEFTLEDLGREAKALVGRNVNPGTVSAYLSEAIRKGFPVTRRRNGHGLPVAYRVEKLPPLEKEPRQDPSPATSPVAVSATSTTMAAAITIHVAIDRARLMDFLESLGVHLVPGGIELEAIHLRSV